jgi:hypothetical protein
MKLVLYLAMFSISGILYFASIYALTRRRTAMGNGGMVAAIGVGLYSGLLFAPFLIGALEEKIIGGLAVPYSANLMVLTTFALWAGIGLAAKGPKREKGGTLRREVTRAS